MLRVHTQCFALGDLSVTVACKMRQKVKLEELSGALRKASPATPSQDSTTSAQAVPDSSKLFFDNPKEPQVRHFHSCPWQYLLIHNSPLQFETWSQSKPVLLRPFLHAFVFSMYGGFFLPSSFVTSFPVFQVLSPPSLPCCKPLQFLQSFLLL